MKMKTQGQNSARILFLLYKVLSLVKYYCTSVFWSSTIGMCVKFFTLYIQQVLLVCVSIAVDINIS